MYYLCFRINWFIWNVQLMIHRFPYQQGKKSSKKKDKGTTSRSVSTMGEQSMQIMPSGSAVSFAGASKDTSADKIAGTEPAIVEQKGPESLPDIKEVDDGKKMSIALDLPPTGVVSPRSPPSSGVVSPRSLKENYQDVRM